MASIFDKFLNSMRLYDDDELDEDVEYLDDESEEEEEPERVEKPVRQERSERQERSPKRGRTPVYEEEEEEAPRPVRAPRRSNVTTMRQAPVRSGSVMEVSMVKPSSMEDARDICDMLLSGRAVVINMEGVQVELAQRIIDFASGACYSIDGNLQKISSYIFIISPSSIELSGDFQNVLGSVSGSNLRLDG